MPDSSTPTQEAPPPAAPPALVVGVPREIQTNERRVAATPTTVKKLRSLGIDVVVQSGAGEEASFLDAAYQEAGARVVPSAAALYAQADLVLKVRGPGAIDGGSHEVDLLKEGAT